MTEDDTVGARILRIAESHPTLNALTRKDLATALKVSYETLRKWVSGDAAPSRKRAEALALQLGVRVETFMHGVVYVIPSLRQINETAGEGETLVAQAMSPESLPSPPRSRSPTIDWGDREMIKKHSQFCMVVPDDSMAPILRTGIIVEFDSEPVKRDEVRNGETVLVEDASGDWYIRTYVKATPKRWQAVPQRGVPLESDRDGLVVLAVLIGTSGRHA